jgi:hypothetical protein
MPERRFTPDRATYIRAHVLLAVVGGIVATVVLYAMGNPHGWVGIVAAVLGIGVRGAYLMSEELGHVWTLTETDIEGPEGRRIALDSIARVRVIGSAAQVISHDGHKHLIKFLAEPAAAKAAIEAALSRRAA